MLYNKCYVMLCYITCMHVMLNHICHLMFSNMCHVMLCYITCVMFCDRTYVMLRYTTLNML